MLLARTSMLPARSCTRGQVSPPSQPGKKLLQWGHTAEDGSTNNARMSVTARRCRRAPDVREAWGASIWPAPEPISYASVARSMDSRIGSETLETLCPLGCPFGQSPHVSRHMFRPSGGAAHLPGAAPHHAISHVTTPCASTCMCVPDMGSPPALPTSPDPNVGRQERVTRVVLQ